MEDAVPRYPFHYQGSICRVEDICMLNMSQGFLHIPICDVLRGLLCFECGGKRLSYKQLPQGWALSAAAFHLQMKALLTSTSAVVYVDDVLIRGKTEWEHC